jgi:CheY-like chemotaxis protein
MPLLALVVDDSMLIRHTVCRSLEKCQLQVQTANDGEAALEILKTTRPDVIFTDMQMPRLSGPELIDALKSNSATADIPIVVLAAKPSSGTFEEPRAHAIIYKDLNIDVQLKQVVETLFPKDAGCLSPLPERK